MTHALSVVRIRNGWNAITQGVQRDTHDPGHFPPVTAGAIDETVIDCTDLGDRKLVDALLLLSC